MIAQELPEINLVRALSGGGLIGKVVDVRYRFYAVKGSREIGGIPKLSPLSYETTAKNLYLTSTTYPLNPPPLNALIKPLLYSTT